MVEERGWQTYRVLLLATAVALLALPFVTTFNDALTAVVMKLGLDAVLTDWVVPMLARMVAVLLMPLGIPVTVTSTGLNLGDLPGLAIYISWNCVGWQSLILFLLTLITGLQGPYTWGSKVQCVLLGVLGIFLLNLFRIAAVALVAYWFGQMPAILFHDYGTTLLTISWLAAFWIFAYRSVLEPEEGALSELTPPASSPAGR